ncbi:MAG: lysophospholipid acyltransferase family protein [Desulfovibrionaceae bacterium]
MRTLIFYLLAPPITIFYSSLMCVLSWHPQRMRIGNWISHRWSRAIVALLGVDLRVDLSALDPGQNYVFMAPHQSNLDIPLVFALLDQYATQFVAKKSLFRIPIFGWAMFLSGQIGIDRANRRAGMKSVQLAVERAQQGFSPIIFPEGTRNEDLAQLLPFKIGGMVLALKCGRPVAPIIITGTGRLLPKHRLRPDRSVKIRVRALPPVDPSAYTLKDRERFKDDMYALMNGAYQEMLRDA